MPVSGMGRSGNPRSVRIAAAAVVFLAATVLQSACRNSGTAALTVTGGQPVAYRTETGELVTARYYSLSDGSLAFVKVTIPGAQGNREYTLPQILSASGVRYTDERELVWWTKGDTARAEIRGEDGEWVTLYDDCRRIRT